ncbi:MAG TPA: DNA polymerase IV [Acetobacteraceae bacterium]|nr:DNA polymerase IV [Acetobacteraceae bacterium]
MDHGGRKIIHIDMDAFYASVEQRDDPRLRGVPLAVGGSRERGVVMAASYEARRFGVRSAMPSVTAARLCPGLVFVPPRFAVYRQISAQIREILAAYTPLIEPLSLDEAYLDVTPAEPGAPYASRMAREIRAGILAQTGLTASAGISYNKFLAKLASDQRKPNGQFTITPEMGPGFVEHLDVGRFHGVGPATEAKMHALGIRTGADLRRCTEAFLARHFGKTGAHFHKIARGIDERPVVPDRPRKSAGSETTFPRDLDDAQEINQALAPLVDDVWAWRERSGMSGRTVTVKVKYADFEQVTRSRTLPHPVASRAELAEASRDLIGGVFPLRKPIRLLGVSISNFGVAGLEAGPQMAFAF